MRVNILWNSGTQVWKPDTTKTKIICFLPLAEFRKKGMKKKLVWKWSKCKGEDWNVGIPKTEIILFLSPSTFQLLAYCNVNCCFILRKREINGKSLPFLTATIRSLSSINTKQMTKLQFHFMVAGCCGLTLPSKAFGPRLPSTAWPLQEMSLPRTQLEYQWIYLENWKMFRRWPFPRRRVIMKKSHFSRWQSVRPFPVPVAGEGGEKRE